MRNVLPERILYRKKIGFRAPIGVWFRTNMRDYVHDLLVEPNARTATILNHDLVQDMLTEHDAAEKNHESAIWTLLNLKKFLRRSDASVA